MDNFLEEAVLQQRKRLHEMARIEVPAWSAEDPRLVDALHASVLADARPAGYSYVLSQAH
ncbi:MAG: hypothetical protein WAV05_18585 [Anaerolineales bacterium]